LVNWHDKNKGDKFDPKNYRPITIVSCLGKLFTAILNERLTEFSESFSVLSESKSFSMPISGHPQAQLGSLIIFALNKSAPSELH
jgi:hypothetical protein